MTGGGFPSQFTLWLKCAASSPRPLRVFELIFDIDTSISKKNHIYVCVSVCVRARVFISGGSPETRLLLLLFPGGLLFPFSSHPAVFTRQIKLQDTFKSKQLSTHISAFLGHVASPRTLTDYTLFFKRVYATLMGFFFFFFWTRLSSDDVPVKSSSSSCSEAPTPAASPTTSGGRRASLALFCDCCSCTQSDKIKEGGERERRRRGGGGAAADKVRQ